VGENLMLHSYLKDKFFNEIESGIMVEVGAAGPNLVYYNKNY
jgi:hypothetical protein